MVEFVIITMETHELLSLPKRIQQRLHGLWNEIHSG